MKYVKNGKNYNQENNMWWHENKERIVNQKKQKKNTFPISLTCSLSTQPFIKKESLNTKFWLEQCAS
jgi:hypothetical protein